MPSCCSPFFWNHYIKIPPNTRFFVVYLRRYFRMTVSWGSRDLGDPWPSNIPWTFWREMACTHTLWCCASTWLGAEVNIWKLMAVATQCIDELIEASNPGWDLDCRDPYASFVSSGQLEAWCMLPQLTSMTRMTSWAPSCCCLPAGQQCTLLNSLQLWHLRFHEYNEAGELVGDTWLPNWRVF